MKSLYTQLSEAIDKMTKSQRDKFYEQREKGSTIETQINCAEAILSGKVKAEESAPIKKNNGASQQFVEGSPFNRERSAVVVAESTKKNDPFAKADRMIYDRLLKQHKITESQHAKLCGVLPAELTTPLQKAEYELSRAIGLSESEALAVALQPLVCV